jgi:hypothetical protein
MPNLMVAQRHSNRTRAHAREYPLIWRRIGGQDVVVFVPKGLQDSARGFNPGNMSTQRHALKGRKIFMIGGPFGQSTPDAPVLPPLQGGAFYESAPGVKTPG